jgi:hypothetical protein
MQILIFLLSVVAALSSAAAQAGEWEGCERFPGFGSARDDVTLAAGGTGTGLFNISTLDFLGSHECIGSPDLAWSHHGTYECDASRGSVRFTRLGLWIEAMTLGGQLFGKVLCPRVSLTIGNRTYIPLELLPVVCSSLTFNNCAVFYDALESEGDGASLRRSSAPSCDATKKILANGPVLKCTQGTCFAPCSSSDYST